MPSKKDLQEFISDLDKTDVLFLIGCLGVMFTLFMCFMREHVWIEEHMPKPP